MGIAASRTKQACVLRGGKEAFRGGPSSPAALPSAVLALRATPAWIITVPGPAACSLPAPGHVGPLLRHDRPATPSSGLPQRGAQALQRHAEAARLPQAATAQAVGAGGAATRCRPPPFTAACSLLDAVPLPCLLHDTCTSWWLPVVLRLRCCTTHASGPPQPTPLQPTSLPRPGRHGCDAQPL